MSQQQTNQENLDERSVCPQPKKDTEKVRSGIILWRTIKYVGAQRIFVGYVVFVLACCALFRLIEPETFSSYGQAVWYCFQTITTIGFGDVVPTSSLIRAISVVIGLSALFVVALLTGLTVSFFNEKMRVRRNESFIQFEYEMEHLSELSPEELKRLEQQYRTFVGKKRMKK